ncbi:MAG TPA: hypothetical protein VGE88_07070 [Lysobacter sp.]
MCKTPKAPKPPPVVQRDPVAEQKQAEATAQSEANKAIASRRKRLRESSLFTVGQAGVRGGPGYSAYAASEGVSKSNTLGGT